LLPPRRAIQGLFATALLLGLAWGCAASNDAGPNGTMSSGGTTGIGEAGNDQQTLRPDGSGDAGESSLGLNPLCGKAPRCVPDLAGACSSYVPPSVASDASVDTAPSVTGQAGANGDGGGPGELAAGGASGAVGSAGASAQAGAAGAAGATSAPAPEFSCQVQRTAGDPESVEAQCGLVGTGQVNAPCLTSSDCGFDAQHGALGCVGDSSAGLCEPYCCKGDNTCAAGTFCAERPLRDALTNAQAQGAGESSAPTVMIPVCVPAQNCDLGTPYPCPTGTECACASGTACLVVRADGTTTCAVPGAGKVGDACPCAWGNVCSVATNQCLKLCYTRGTPSCGDGTCQSSAELPDGWGVCVGTSLPSGG
jgi:hypothetical protein